MLEQPPSGPKCEKGLKHAPSALPPPWLPHCRATCTLYTQACTLTVEHSSSSDMNATPKAEGGSRPERPQFVLRTAGGAEYRGATPTAPLAKLALHLGQPAVVNGMEVSSTDKQVRLWGVLRACLAVPSDWRSIWR